MRALQTEAFAGFYLTTSTNPVATLLQVLRPKQTLSAAGQELDSLEMKISEYKSYARYLQRRDRTAYLTELESLSKRVENLQTWAPFLRGANRKLLRSLQSRNATIKSFLEGFLFEYINAEVNRRKAFFDRARLDDSQKAAVIKNDSHHLVLAAAGSGKTRALTARIALLIERGVPPERILALAYTNAAAEEMENRLRTYYGINANVSTFHSFCRSLAMESPVFRSGVAGQRELMQG
jgi:primosomal protein N'